MTENLTGSSAETAPVEQPDAGEPTAEAAPPRRRPARRTPKLDLVLAAAVDRAREGVLDIAPPEQIGAHVGSVADGDRLVTHRFEAKLAGYAGWQWYATLARVPRGKDATVCEVGLLPSEKSLLAPEWVPWADRVRPEEVAAAAEAEAAAAAEAQDDADSAPVADTAEEVSEPVDQDAAAEEAPAEAGEDEVTNEETSATAGEDDAANEEASASEGEDDAANEETSASEGEDEATNEETSASEGEDEATNEETSASEGEDAADPAAGEKLTEAAATDTTEDFTEATS
ncbi:DUF3027 domain-containing protein [Arthrobacter sp. CAU 1506]|uniref:DUF3027 domain-containing protein n=1 Tax=Arthrobacter sp. CAU 1506 TaxID=2560052 RepID=UPI0010AD80B5|nr:DUF3027 domain-containing protein [Arthrobacter sp. CAU 1506]TJY67501.1 DUF3027 domain-containing protein [Arthrobacter sp. CAU 1506]